MGNAAIKTALMQAMGNRGRSSKARPAASEEVVLTDQELGIWTKAAQAALASDGMSEANKARFAAAALRAAGVCKVVTP